VLYIITHAVSTFTILFWASCLPIVAKIPLNAIISHRKTHSWSFFSLLSFWNWFLDKTREPLQPCCQEYDPCNPKYANYINQYFNRNFARSLLYMFQVQSASVQGMLELKIKLFFNRSSFRDAWLLAFNIKKNL